MSGRALMRTAAKIAACVSAGMLWVVSASALYLWSCSRLDLLTFPFWQWFMAAPYYTAMPVRVGLSAFVPFTIIMLTAFCFSRRRNLKRKMLLKDPAAIPKIERANTDNHGHAQFMTNPRARELFPADAGKMIGIPLGERRPLFDECFNTSGISLEFVGTRMFKAQPLDALVLTPSGFRKMGSLNVGDLVTSPDGKAVPVVGVHPQGRKEVFRVVFSDGRSTRCCEDHLWKVWGKLSYSMGWRTESLGWIIRQMNMKAVRMGRLAVPLVDPYAIDFPPQDLPISPYTLGVILGDGHIKKHSVVVSTTDDHILSRIQEENQGYSIVPADGCDYRLTFKNRPAARGGRTLPSQARTNEAFARGGYNDTEVMLEAQGRVQGLRKWAKEMALTPGQILYRLRAGWSVAQACGLTCRPKRIDTSYSPLMKSLRNLGLTEARSADKFIPEIFKTGSLEQRLAILQGLLDTDGCVSNEKGTSASFVSVSRQLARDVRDVCLSLGARVKITESQSFYTYNGVRREGAPAWRLTIVHPDISRMFSLPRKLAQCRPKRMQHRLNIVGIQPDGTEETQCISVGSTDGLYVTDDYIVTHNTMRAISSLAFWPNSRIVFDPAQEIAPMMWRFLTAQGQRVLIMNPDEEPKDSDGNPYPWAPFIASTNVISWIDTKDPLAAMHVHTIAGLFFEMDSVQKTDNGEFFTGTAESMLAALISYVLWDEGQPGKVIKLTNRWLSLNGDDNEEIVIPAVAPVPRDLITVRDCLSLPEPDLRMLLKYIRDHSSSSLARHYAGPLFDADHKTFSSIHHTCHQATRWLAIDALANMVCGDDFSITDIATDPNLALFIQPPMTVCNKHKGIVRLIFGALMNAKIMNPDETFPLVLTDESWLVRVEAIREIILNGGKYRIALHMIWQSIGSLDRVWGRDTRKEFFDGAAWIAVGPVGDVDSAREISEACGTFGALEHSAGDNSSVQAGTSLWGRWSRGNTGNRHPVKRSVLFLHETMQDLHRGVRLILRLPQPLIVGAGPYWEIPILRDMIDPSPYARVRPEKKPPWWRLICS